LALIEVVGVKKGITKEQSAAIASALIKGIPEPIEVITGTNANHR
jgi:hypothetical protein